MGVRVDVGVGVWGLGARVCGWGDSEGGVGIGWVGFGFGSSGWGRD